MSDKRTPSPLTINGVPLTEDDVGRKVRYHTYEGYQNTKPLGGEGVIKSIDFRFGQVHISTGKERPVYFRGYRSGVTDVVTMRAEYSHHTKNRELNRGEVKGWQLDMPAKFKYQLEFIDDECSEPDQSTD